MGKAEETRQKIIVNAAELFNVQGYSGTAISDVMTATGLKKGGIYAHFESKEDLAIAAFDYAYERTSERYREILDKHKDDPVTQLMEIIEDYRDMDTASPVKGGCPLLNTAIESDDYHPKLKRRAQAMMRQWQRFIKHVLKNGITAGVFYETIDMDNIATMIISSVEGGLMMSKLMDNSQHLNLMVDLLRDYVEQNVII